MRWLLAVQAQDYPGARWSLGLRVPGLTEPDVDAALDAGLVLRSWPLRGTLHFVAAEDLHWLLTLGAARVLAGARARHQALGIDAKTIEAARAAAHDVLGGGRALDRDALLSAWEARGIQTGGQRGYHLLWTLAQTGTLCFGPVRDGAQQVVLVDEWVRAPRRLAREEALGELARRYFTSRGPATLKDFVGWSKLPVTDARTGIAVAGPALVAVTIGDTPAWAAAAALDAGAAVAAGSVLALPGFDEYVLGYQDRSAVLDPAHAGRIVPGGNGVFMPTIVADGRVVGTWRRRHTAAATLVQPEPFAALPAKVLRGFTAAARAYGRFLGRPVELTPA